MRLGAWTCCRQQQQLVAVQLIKQESNESFAPVDGVVLGVFLGAQGPV